MSQRFNHTVVVLQFALICAQVKSDKQWMLEYRKLELKTRMQLQAKDREINRLRKVVRHLQKENNDNLDQLFSEMKSQVENVAKWVDLQSKALPHSNLLLKIALSREFEGRHGDLYSSYESQLSSSTSNVSSKQSTLERCHQRKESPESYYPSSTYTPSNCDSNVATPTEGTVTLEGYSDLIVQLITKNISNPSTATESDASDITRPMQATECTLNLVSQSDSNGSGDLQIAHSMNSSSATRTKAGTETTPSLSTNVSSTSAVVSLPSATTDEPHTPSTVKSNATTPKSSLHGSPTQFDHGNGIALQQEEEPMADLKAVFKRIQGKDFL